VSVFKHKINQQTHVLVLQHRSLLAMKGTTQIHWMHRLPPTKKANFARVNLAFKSIITE
jgi:alkylated DNA repair dioxygenase AlkB